VATDAQSLRAAAVNREERLQHLESQVEALKKAAAEREGELERVATDAQRPESRWKRRKLRHLSEAGSGHRAQSLSRSGDRGATQHLESQVEALKKAAAERRVAHQADRAE
jgi:hypothetical protein